MRLTLYIGLKPIGVLGGEANTIIDLDEDRDLFRNMYKAELGKPLITRITGYINARYTAIVEDGIGDEIRWASPKELVDWISIQSLESAFNRAAFTFVSLLNEDYHVGLYWY